MTNTLLPQTPGLPGWIMFADIYHGDNVVDLGKTAEVLVGLVHKADQGTAKDPAYARRREMWLSQPPFVYERPDGTTLSIPRLWGAYDFNTGQDVATQVADFVRDAMIDEQTLGCIDYEDNSASQMSAAQLVEWTRRFADATGQLPKIYSGNRIKSVNARFSDADREWLAQCDFWLAQYSARDVLSDYNGHPLPWVNWNEPAGTPHRLWAWQRDADGAGPDKIKTVPGLQPVGKLDEDVFDGTPEDLMNTWVRRVAAA